MNWIRREFHIHLSNVSLPLLPRGFYRWVLLDAPSFSSRDNKRRPWRSPWSINQQFSGRSIRKGLGIAMCYVTALRVTRPKLIVSEKRREGPNTWGWEITASLGSGLMRGGERARQHATWRLWIGQNTLKKNDEKTQSTHRARHVPCPWRPGRWRSPAPQRSRKAGWVQRPPFLLALCLCP